MTTFDSLEEVLDVDGLADDHYTEDGKEYEPIRHLDPVGGGQEFVDAGITEANGWRYEGITRHDVANRAEANDGAVYTVDLKNAATGETLTVLMGYDGANDFPLLSVEEFEGWTDTLMENLAGVEDDGERAALHAAVVEHVEDHFENLEAGAYFTVEPRATDAENARITNAAKAVVEALNKMLVSTARNSTLDTDEMFDELKACSDELTAALDVPNCPSDEAMMWVAMANKTRAENLALMRLATS